MEDTIKAGDTVTIEGFYRKRMFWQWLTGKPADRSEYVVIHLGEYIIGDGEITESKQ